MASACLEKPHKRLNAAACVRQAPRSAAKRANQACEGKRIAVVALHSTRVDENGTTT
jgi:hypothetical protein